MPKSLPRVFIGSSTEALNDAYIIQEHLDRFKNVRAIVWTDRNFGPGFVTIESLMTAIHQFDFAVLLLTPDDETTIRGTSQRTVRDNVLFELGLFMAHLGRLHTFVVRREDCRLPSDLEGLTNFLYRRDADNPESALGPVCRQLHSTIQERPPQLRSQVFDSAVRGDGEKQEPDELLSIATEAHFVAMTYKTLGEALTSTRAITSLPKLTRAELAIYSLPVLQLTHPTLIQADAVQNEWQMGVACSIKFLLDEQRCSSLRDLDVVVMSVPPTFTASKLMLSQGQTLIRYTPVVSGVEPKLLPTLYIAPGPEKTKVFGQFDEMFKIPEPGRKRAPLRFTLKRDGKLLHDNPDAFIAELKYICNNPLYQPSEHRFVAQIRRSQNATKTPEAEDVYKLYKARKPADPFRAEVDLGSHTVTFGKNGRAASIARLECPHIVACFVLLTAKIDESPGNGGHNVYLVYVEKGEWTHDVPGGKVAARDRTLQDTVRREVFEELGLLLDIGRIGEPVGFKYDLKSALEHVPVLPIYFGYRLDPNEREYLGRKRAMSTKGHRIGPYSLQRLIDDKRSQPEHTCHAPLEALVSLQQSLVQAP